jgi:uncharacterized membrane protein
MERRYLFGIDDGGRTAGMVSYFFVIGWSIGFFGFHQPNKNTLSAFHLRQTLCLYLTFLAIWFGLSMVPATIIQQSAILNIETLKLTVVTAFLGLWIYGLNAATNAEEKPIPVIGPAAQYMFSFLVKEGH